MISWSCRIHSWPYLYTSTLLASSDTSSPFRQEDPEQTFEIIGGNIFELHSHIDQMYLNFFLVLQVLSTIQQLKIVESCEVIFCKWCSDISNSVHFKKWDSWSFWQACPCSPEYHPDRSPLLSNPNHGATWPLTSLSVVALDRDPKMGVVTAPILMRLRSLMAAGFTSEHETHNRSTFAINVLHVTLLSPRKQESNESLKLRNAPSPSTIQFGTIMFSHHIDIFSTENT